MCKIIIVDDHKIVIESLLQTFDDSKDGITVVGTAENGQEVLDLLQHQEVDVVVLDISMPGMDGGEALISIKQNYPGVKVLMLTMYKDGDRIIRMLQTGANGYLPKNRSGKEVVKAVKTLMQGDYYFPDDIQKAAFQSLIPKEFIADEIKRIILTEKEEEIMTLLAAGNQVKIIADKLCISPKTVESHKANLMKKIHAQNVQDVVRYAVKNGYCPD